MAATWPSLPAVGAGYWSESIRRSPTRSKTQAEVAVMGGREMQGWLRVDLAHLRTKQQLAKWVKLGTTYAGSLPAKH